MIYDIVSVLASGETRKIKSQIIIAIKKNTPVARIFVRVFGVNLTMCSTVVRANYAGNTWKEDATFGCCSSGVNEFIEQKHK